MLSDALGQTGRGSDELSGQRHQTGPMWKCPLSWSKIPLWCCLMPWAGPRVGLASCPAGANGEHQFEKGLLNFGRISTLVLSDAVGQTGRGSGRAVRSKATGSTKVEVVPKRSFRGHFPTTHSKVKYNTYGSWVP